MNGTGIDVIEKQPLDIMLAVTDQPPPDFYKNPAYLERVKAAAELTRNLKYTIDEEGKKQAKSDVAAIRKYAKNTNGFTLSVFKSMTDKVKTWRDAFSAEIKALEHNADQIMAQFERMEREQLDKVMDIVSAELKRARQAANIRVDFQSCADVSPLVKLSGTLTPSGNLTAKAISFIAAIVAANLAAQQQFDNRVNIVKIRCLENDINPPIAPLYFGTVFHADDDVFNAKLDELVAAELSRMAAMKERLVKQQEEQKQRDIAAALKAQRDEDARLAHEEKNRLALEKQWREREEEAKNAPQPVAAPIPENTTRAQADYKVDVKPAVAAQSKRTVIITATFAFEGISGRVSNAGVEDFFKKQLPTKMAAILTSVDSANELDC